MEQLRTQRQLAEQTKIEGYKYESFICSYYSNTYETKRISLSLQMQTAKWKVNTKQFADLNEAIAYAKTLEQK